MIDSITQTATLTAATMTSWEKRSSTPNSVEANESEPRTTTSTATPSRSSGSTSAAVFTVVAATAATTRGR